MSDLQVIFMDAGQGDCTLIVYPDGSLTLVDFGSTKSGAEAFEEIFTLLSLFLPAGKTISTLVLTHPDADHYNKLGALFSKVPSLKFDRIYYGGDINLYKNTNDGNFTYNLLAEYTKAGKAAAPKNNLNVTPDPCLSRKGINVYVLASNITGNPKDPDAKIKNRNSIVLLLEVPGVAKVFLMGDAFKETEYKIIGGVKMAGESALLTPGGAEVVLKMGHHGSDTSTSKEWVRQIVPNILVVSSGTKMFGPKGMPTITHLDETIAAATCLELDTKISQTYVVFDPAKKRGQNFVTEPATTKGIWTTCYQAAWNGMRWLESGQTWYYGVTFKGNKAKERWRGYTGYEEEEDQNADYMSRPPPPAPRPAAQPAMTVETLKQQLRAAAGGTFTLAAADLGVAGAQELIDTWFGGRLAVASASPEVDALTVSGTGSIDPALDSRASLRNRPIQLWFTTDDAGGSVTGLLVAVQSAGWSITTSLLEFAGEWLSGPGFTSLALALSARPEDGTDQAFGAGVGVYATADTTPVFLSAVLPADEQTSQSSDLVLAAGFGDGIPLTDLEQLGTLLPGGSGGYAFAAAVSVLPLASEFALRSVRFVANPTLRFVVTAGMEVRSARPWAVVRDRFEFEWLDIDFRIHIPGAESAIWWSVSTEMELGSGVEVIVGIDSDLNVDAELGEPVSIRPLLDRWAPAADLDFTLDALRVEADFGCLLTKADPALPAGTPGGCSESPPPWGLTLEVESGWTLFDTVAVRSVEVALAGAGASLEVVQVNGTLTLGDAVLYVAAVMNQGAGWDFSGQMTHDYDVRLQPATTVDFTTGAALIQSVPMGNNASHFFSNVFDALFPGGSSGVPPLLDLNIKCLKVHFNTFTKDFDFEAEIEFGSDVDTVLTFSSLHQQGAAGTTFQKRATGVFTLFPKTPGALKFDLGIDLQPGSRHFVAAYSNPSGAPLPLAKLVRALFPHTPVTPPEGFSVTLKDAIVGYVSDAGTSQTVFAVDMGASLDLSSLGDIPLVGQTLSAARTLKLAFQIVYPAIAPGATLAKAELAALNALVPAAGPRFPADQDLTGLLVRTELRLGDGAPIDFGLPVTVDPDTGTLQKAPGAPPFDPPGTQPTDDGTKWLTLNKSFGPLSLRRAGFRFDSGSETVTVLLDGGLTAAGLQVDLTGLSVSAAVTGVTDFSPTFSLQGLGISFSGGGVEIQGAFLHLNDEYDGLATVQAEGVRLSAIGSLTEVNGTASLFIYGVLDYPLGGVPAFYVTGLAAGFGLNRRFVPPSVDQVATFPLIADAVNPPAVPTDPGSAGTFITAQMQKLDPYLPAGLGQYFLAAGIRFTSFELLDSFVILSISFGREFELDLLGLTSLVVPPQAQAAPLAVIRLQILATFNPSEGVAMVQGQLTRDSYLLDPSCHLTGGFAFGGWFAPSPCAGDFVVTLGGYHPQFRPPSYYPTVPRIGVSWKVSTELSVTGGFYFALTPRAIMAGGALQAIFQVSVDAGIASADVKAWFILGADFIVFWKPFSYSADLYVDMGVDVTVHFLGTHHLSVDAGADLEVWGPPFSGHAYVHFKVIGIKIGFNVDFGAAASPPPPLDWDNADPSRSFRQSFLPPDAQIASASVDGGLLRKVDLSTGGGGAMMPASTGGDAPNPWYVVNPKDLALRTQSVIPVKTAETAIGWADGKSSLADFGGNTGFGIAPMDRAQAAVGTFHQVTVTRSGKGAEASFALRPVLANVPGGLWAEANSDDVNATPMISQAVVGLEIVPAAAPTPGATNELDRSLLEYTTFAMGSAWTPGTLPAFTTLVPSPGDDPAGNQALWARIQSEIHTNAVRDAILADQGFGPADLDIGQSFTIDSAFAPQYGALAF